MSVLLITSLGEIVIDLYVDDCPKACTNFIKLCKIKYYNNCLFYNVQKDYLAQSGDPTCKERESTSIYGIVNGESQKYFEDEINPKFKHNQIGIVATANPGPNMNTSSFYIQLTNKHLLSLNNKHTIFGKVEEGLDVLTKINNAYCDNDNRPYQNIRIRHTVILDDPFDDLDGMIIPAKSPDPYYDNSEYNRLEDDFDINEFYKDKQTEEKLKEKLQEQEAKNKAIILELLEDIPDSEIKPPENVLFVCKLNPITQDNDLESIFSRFGPIKSCQVIRDKKTGESLKYAFIEFEKVEDCEKAYLKMNGVLIDDRRIKVDFSQSVSKYWYNYNKPNINARKEENDDKNGHTKNNKGNLQMNEENVLTLVNEKVKLEIKHNDNFNPQKRRDKYNFVFDEEQRQKQNKKSRSRSSYHHIHSSHHHHHHHRREKK